jgi:hypothetical protein
MNFPKNISQFITEISSNSSKDRILKKPCSKPTKFPPSFTLLHSRPYHSVCTPIACGCKLKRKINLHDYSLFTRNNCVYHFCQFSRFLSSCRFCFEYAFFLFNLPFFCLTYSVGTLVYFFHLPPFILLSKSPVCT